MRNGQESECPLWTVLRRSFHRAHRARLQKRLVLLKGLLRASGHLVSEAQIAQESLEICRTLLSCLDMS